MGTREHSTDQQESWASREQPLTEMQALMEARPGEEPKISRERSQPIQEKIAEAMTHLGNRERWIINGYIYERKPLRQLAAELGLSKTQVARIRDYALDKLSRILGDDDEVRRYDGQE